jgi:hypothetical protein
MKIGIITPAPPRSRYGNRVTAVRWAGILRELGHRVKLAQNYSNESFELLIALHARRSCDAIHLFRRQHSHTPLFVALTGTDLYQDLARSRQAQRSLEYATRIVVLQPKAIEELPPHLRNKTRVIYQSVRLSNQHNKSARSPACRPKSSQLHGGYFEVCVIGHLRPVKDPFRTALAVRRLPHSSRIRIRHLGGAMHPDMADRARAEMRINSRYRWLGEQPRRRTQQILANSHL